MNTNTNLDSRVAADASDNDGCPRALCAYVSERAKLGLETGNDMTRTFSFASHRHWCGE